MEELCFGFNYYKLPELNLSEFSSQSECDSETTETTSKFSASEFYARFSCLKQITHPNLSYLVDLMHLGHKKFVLTFESYEEHFTHKDFYTETELKSCLYQILSAVVKLMKEGIALLNLEPKHIQLMNRNHPKLVQFGEYSLLGEHLKRNKLYCAPEEFQVPGSLHKIDTWALGVIFLEVLSGLRVPLENPLTEYRGLVKEFSVYKEHSTELCKFFAFELVKVPVSQNFKEVLGLMLRFDPLERYDAYDLLHHPYFLKVDLPVNESFPYSFETLFYLWKKYKKLKKTPEQYFISIGLIHYTPPVLKIPSVITGDEASASVVSSSKQLKIKDFLSLLESEQIEVSDFSSFTQDKNLSEGVYARSESFFGKLGSVFKSKSVKSLESEDSSKSVNTFLDKLKKFKEFADKPPFPSPLRASIYKKLLDCDQPELLYSFYESFRLNSSEKQISVDIPRCHQYHLFLSSESGKHKLKKVVKTWASNHPNVKYSQGIDSIAAGFLCLFEKEEQAYFCTDKMIQKYLLESLEQDQVGFKMLLLFRNLLNFVDPLLGQHLHKEGILPEMYASPWIFTLFARIS